MAAFTPAPGAPGSPGMPPQAFPQQPMAAPVPAQHQYSNEPSKAPILTDNLTQFMLWQESFRLRIEQVNPNSVWTLIINNLICNQWIVFLGFGAVQQYADQELMWQWLHEACKVWDGGGMGCSGMVGWGVMWWRDGVLCGVVVGWGVVLWWDGGWCGS
eukprot:310215-Rhodomonas_salina.2